MQIVRGIIPPCVYCTCQELSKILIKVVVVTAVDDCEYTVASRQGSFRENRI